LPIASEPYHGQNHQISGLVHFHFVVIVGFAELDELGGEIGGAKIESQRVQTQRYGTGAFPDGNVIPGIRPCRWLFRRGGHDR
jgi:hypothetical protein